MFTISKKADKTHPCGPPVLIVMMDDSLDSVRTYCCLLVRKSTTNDCNLAGTL